MSLRDCLQQLCTQFKNNQETLKCRTHKLVLKYIRQKCEEVASQGQREYTFTLEELVSFNKQQIDIIWLRNYIDSKFQLGVKVVDDKIRVNWISTSIDA